MGEINFSLDYSKTTRKYNNVIPKQRVRVIDPTSEFFGLEGVVISTAAYNAVVSVKLMPNKTGIGSWWFTADKLEVIR